MANGIILILSVVLFSFCARMLMNSIRLSGIPDYGDQRFTRRALRVSRQYKIIAWSVLSLFLFLSLAQSFWETFSI